jgi:RHS repeat-associated protein
VVERLSYDAWGKRRNANGTDDLTNALISAITDHGYTGHEHLDDMGLIHMNGRVYDPRTGRFLQADPFIQYSDDLQSYNRYTYVMNNPFYATDPSGYLSILGHKILPGVLNNRNARAAVKIVSGIVAVALSPACGPLQQTCASVGVALITSGVNDVNKRPSTEGVNVCVCVNIPIGTPDGSGNIGGNPNAGNEGSADSSNNATRSNYSDDSVSRVVYKYSNYLANSWLDDNSTNGNLVDSYASEISLSVNEATASLIFPPTFILSELPVEVIPPRVMTPFEQLPTGAAGGAGANKAFPRSGNYPEGVPCTYCGKPTTKQRGPDQLNKDHIIPRKNNGNNTPPNEAPSCRRCNQQKGGRTPQQWYIDNGWAAYLRIEKVMT